jgi:uncharacterized protein
VRILTAGASGFLGTPLRRRLRESGHDVVQLVRREPRAPGEVRWDPASGTLDPTALSTVDAVVNLGGASIAGWRWTERYKERLRASRIDTTTTLATAIANADGKPAVLLSASGVHYYGDTGDRTADETSPQGDGFLANLCREWEAATRPAEDAGTRVVHLRSGLPLARNGGFLAPALLQFKLFAGGRLGTGRQYVAWISLPDWLGAVEFLLDRDDIRGPVNVTGPDPVRNAEFTRKLAKRLHRPALVPVPTMALRLALGELATEALMSQRVLPGVLSASGFAHQHRTVDEALRWALDH